MVSCAPGSYPGDPSCETYVFDVFRAGSSKGFFFSFVLEKQRHRHAGELGSELREALNASATQCLSFHIFSFSVVYLHPSFNAGIQNYNTTVARLGKLFKKGL